MKKNLVITIGRECGSSGRAIGRKLAESLGIKCYDKELLALAAKNSGLCEELFKTHDEKPTNSFLYSLVLLVKTFAFTSCTIPSTGMENSLYQGERVLVNKWSYGFRVPFSITVCRDSINVVNINTKGQWKVFI